MRKTLRVEVGSHLASSDVIGSPLDVWREVEAFFRHPQLMSVVGERGTDVFEVTVDPSDVLRYLLLAEEVESGDAAAATRLKRRFNSRFRARRPMMGADLRVTIWLPKGAASLLNHALTLFLQKLFLATNLGCPGSCDLGSVRGGSDSDKTGDLHGNQIAFAAVHAMDRTWPRLRRIPVADVWQWLDRNSFDQTVLAASPLAKALLTLLNIARSELDHA